jgi:hypothetical protein
MSAQQSGLPHISVPWTEAWLSQCLHRSLWPVAQSPSKCEALCSNPSITTTTKKTKSHFLKSLQKSGRPPFAPVFLFLSPVPTFVPYFSSRWLHHVHCTRVWPYHYWCAQKTWNVVLFHQVGLKFTILLPQPPKCWDYRHVPPWCLAENLE